ncbi:hypothetical protein Bca101_033981 [Brassica carinata]
MARKICLDDVEVKLGELEAELFVVKAINDNWSHIESGRDPENYFKYSVQDIERIVLDFFEETMKEEDWRGGALLSKLDLPENRSPKGKKNALAALYDLFIMETYAERLHVILPLHWLRCFSVDQAWTIISNRILEMEQARN